MRIRFTRSRSNCSVSTASTIMSNGVYLIMHTSISVTLYSGQSRTSAGTQSKNINLLRFKTIVRVFLKLPLWLFYLKSIHIKVSTRFIQNTTSGKKMDLFFNTKIRGRLIKIRSFSSMKRVDDY